MAVAPAFTYAAITSSEVVGGTTKTNVGTSEQTLFENVNLVPGKYHIDATWANPTSARITVSGGSSSVTATGDGIFEVSASGTYTITIKSTSGSKVGATTPKLMLDFDWSNENTEFTSFQANVMGYISAISDYATPDKDTNVDLNDCKQASEIDWSAPANQTYANYVNHKLYAFSGVTLAAGEKNLQTMFANAQAAINGAEANEWLPQAQALLDQFTTAETGLDARIAAVKTAAATETYTDGSETKEIKMADHATNLETALMEDGVGERDLIADLVDFLTNYNPAADGPLPTTEYKAKFAVGGDYDLAVKAATKKVEDLESYNEYITLYAATARTELTNLETLLQTLQAGIDGKNAAIDQKFVTDVRYNQYRFRAFGEALNEFLKQAEANYAGGAWAYPSKLAGFTVPAIDWDNDGNVDFADKNISYNSTKTASGHMAGAITTLIGSSSSTTIGWAGDAIDVMSTDDAFPVEKYAQFFSIRHTISYLKWRSQDYQKAYEGITAAFEKADKKYNKEITRLETAIQEWDAMAATTAAADEFLTLLENAKVDLKAKYKDADKTSIEALKTQYENSYKDGVIYDADGNVVNMNNDALNWDNANRKGFEDGTDATKAEKWIKDIEGETTDLTTDVDAYIAKAKKAAERYEKLYDLINGTTAADQLAKMQADLGIDAFPDQVKTPYTEAYNQITTDLGTLTTNITNATKTVDATGLDMKINNDADWDDTNLTSTWNTEDDTDDVLTYADVKKKITDLAANLAAAKAEYDAWQTLLAEADDLAARLQAASIALDGKGTTFTPAYQPSLKYGYKGIGDAASENTLLAKDITDYVAALKAAANTAYGVGTANAGLTAGAQTLLAKTPGVSTDVDTNTAWTVVGGATQTNDPSFIEVQPDADTDEVSTTTASPLTAGMYTLSLDFVTMANTGAKATVKVLDSGSNELLTNAIEVSDDKGASFSEDFTLAADGNVTVKVEFQDVVSGTTNFKFANIQLTPFTYGYKADNLIDTDGDSTNDFSWNDGDAQVTRLETGGDIALAVDNWVTFRTNVYADTLACKNFFDQTVNGVVLRQHGIYTDDNHWYADNTQGNKYQTNETTWLNYIKDNGLDIIDAKEALESDAYFTAIKAPLAYTAFGIETQLVMTEATAPEEIAKDMADYEQAAQLKLAQDLNDDLYGRTGAGVDLNDDSTDDVLDDGYIATTKAQFDAAYQAAVTDRAADWAQYDADTKVWDTNAPSDATKTIKTLWDEMDAAINNIELEPTNGRKDIAAALSKANAADSWNKLSLLKKKLDNFSGSDEAEETPTLANNIDSLKNYTLRILDGLRKNYETYKLLIDDTETDGVKNGKVDSLKQAVEIAKAAVVEKVFIKANGEDATYEGYYQDLIDNYITKPSTGFIANAEDLYKDFANFALVEFKNNAWAETDACTTLTDNVTAAAARLNTLKKYTEVYDEYLHVDAALNGNATIAAAIPEYEKKYGNALGAVAEIADPANEDTYGTAAAISTFQDMLTALNTASGASTGNEVNVADIKENLTVTLKDCWKGDTYAAATTTLNNITTALGKLGGLTADEGTTNYSTFTGESMATRVYDYAIQGILEQAKDNQKAYENIVDMKQKLADGVTKALEDLGKLDQTTEGDALIDYITNTYKPMPTAIAPAIVQSYENGQSVAQDIDSPEPTAAELEANPRQYYTLRDSLNALNNRVTEFLTDGYATAIADKNAGIYTNDFDGLYTTVMAAYTKAVEDVKLFNAPKQDDLKTAYEDAILQLNLTLYHAPEQLLNARKAAQQNVTDANAVPETYDPTADIAALNDIKNNVIDASFNTFLGKMKTAAQNAWDAVKTELQATITNAIDEVETEGYYASLDETKDGEGNVTAQAGVTYADHAAIVALFQAQQDIWNVADGLTDLENAGNPAYEEFLQLDEMLTESTDQTLAAIPTGVKAKLNEVAHTDLTVRAQLVNGAALIAGTVLGDKAIMEGMGAKITYDGNDYQYTYKTVVDALNKDGKKWQDFVDRFDQMVADTYTAAENLHTTYNTNAQLPNAVIDEVPTATRQNVLDLLAIYGVGQAYPKIEKFADILADLNVLYDEYTSDMKYNVTLAKLETNFAAEAEGVKSLYVGDDWAPNIEILKNKIEAEKNTKTSLTTVETLLADLAQLVKDAKAEERANLFIELQKMEGEYNILIGSVYKDDETKKNELITKFATDADPAAIDELYIAENEAVVDGAGTDDYDEATAYADYLVLEKNLAHIKTEIGKEIAQAIEDNVISESDPSAELAVTQADLDNMVKTFEDAIEAFENAESKYLAGQKLLAPVNPEMDDAYYLEDFGLYKYYSADNFNAINDAVLAANAKLQTAKENVAKYKAEGTILLYNEKLTQLIADSQIALDLVDAKWNDPDDAASYYALNQVELAKAAAWKGILDREQAVIDAVATFDAEGNVTGGNLKTVIDRIAELGEEWTTTPTLATTITNIGNVQTHLTNMYLSGNLTDAYTVDANTLNSKYPAYSYKDGSSLMIYGLYNLGLAKIKTHIKAALDAAALSCAQKQLADVTAVYNAVKAKLDATKMRQEDKIEMQNIMAGYKAELDNLSLAYGDWKETGEKLTNDNVDAYKAAVKALRDKLATNVSTDPETGDLIVEGGFVDEINGELAGDLSNGDGTGDGVVDVDDLDILLGYVTDGIPTDDPNYDKIFAASDLNGDKVVDISDALILIDMITNQDVSAYIYARSAKAFAETATAEVVSQEGNRQRIAISLNNWRQYTAFQMDIKLPKGMTLVGQELSDRANGQQILTGTPNGKNRIVAYTMDKAAFSGNEGAVLYIDVETTEDFRGGEIEYTNIVFGTTESVGVRFYIGNSETVGISSSKFDAAKQSIYNLGGRMVDTLKKGINIIRGNNGDAQKVIKK